MGEPLPLDPLWLEDPDEEELSFWGEPDGVEVVPLPVAPLLVDPCEP